MSAPVGPLGSVDSEDSVQSGRQQRPRRLDRMAWLVVALVLISSLSVALWRGIENPATDDERTSRLASALQCPTCNGLSVLQSESPMAKASREEIASQIASGRSDDEIRTFFVERYGEKTWVVPRKQGAELLVWMVPLVTGLALVVACVAYVRRVRRSVGVVGAGGVADDADGADGTGSVSPAASVEPSSWSLRKKLVVIVSFVTAVVVAGTALVVVSQSRETKTPEALMMKASERARNNEPLEAIKTYDEVLVMQPSNARALARRSWLLRLAGLTHEAKDGLDTALRLDKTLIEGYYYRAVLRREDLGDSEGAQEDVSAALRELPANSAAGQEWRVRLEELARQ